MFWELGVSQQLKVEAGLESKESQLSLQMTPFRSFSWLSSISLYMYHSFFIHSSVDGYLGCFHVLAIVNSAAMNSGVHVSFSKMVSLRYMPNSGIAGSYYSQFLKESLYCFPQWLYQTAFPPTVQECSFFSKPSPAFIVCRHFDDGHSNWCKVISHCIFYLHFCNNE